MRCTLHHYFLWLNISFVLSCLFFFFFNDTATTEIYTLSLHDALPISAAPGTDTARFGHGVRAGLSIRSEEHTSELQSHSDLVCRLLLEKKKRKHSHGRGRKYNETQAQRTRWGVQN